MPRGIPGSGKSKTLKSTTKGRRGPLPGGAMTQEQIYYHLGALRAICSNNGLGDPIDWLMQPRFTSLKDAVEAAKKAA